MLICDGHDSHITGNFIEYCMYNNILLMILPPHSSHLTQSFDIDVLDGLVIYVRMNSVDYVCNIFLHIDIIFRDGNEPGQLSEYSERASLEF